jgi:hypothetical protein
MTADLVARLGSVADRLTALAETEAPPGALTDPDANTGERWEAGQAWAHLAEFPAYWLAEIDRILRGTTADGGAVPFGRTQSDPGRLAAIERDRTTDRRRLLERVTAGIAAARSRIEELGDREWRARGLHPTRGEMTIPEIVERFLVAHLEEHADQLDKLTAAPQPG